MPLGTLGSGHKLLLPSVHRPQARRPAGVPAPDASPGSEAVQQGKEVGGQDSRALMCVGPGPPARCSPCPWGPRGSPSSLGTSSPSLISLDTAPEMRAPHFGQGRVWRARGAPCCPLGAARDPVNTPSAQKIGRGLTLEAPGSPAVQHRWFTPRPEPDQPRHTRSPARSSPRD